MAEEAPAPAPAAEEVPAPDAQDKAEEAPAQDKSMGYGATETANLGKVLGSNTTMRIAPGICGALCPTISFDYKTPEKDGKSVLSGSLSKPCWIL